MLKERLALANKIASDLHEAEAAIDAAIKKMGTLMVTLPEAQQSAKLSPVASDAAFSHLSAAIHGLMAGRSNMVALHNELNSIKDKVGLRNVIVGTGDLGKLVPKRASLAEADSIVADDVKAA
jgi:Zn-dependent alcohol dehydrogenase